MRLTHKNSDSPFDSYHKANNPHGAGVGDDTPVSSAPVARAPTP
jgi:hypothetical protein